MECRVPRSDPAAPALGHTTAGSADAAPLSRGAAFFVTGHPLSAPPGLIRPASDFFHTRPESLCFEAHLNSS